MDNKKKIIDETKKIVGKHLDKAGIPYSYAGGPEPMVRQKDAGRAKALINKLHKDGTIKRNPGVTAYDKGPNIRPISTALKNKLGIKEATYQVDIDGLPKMFMDTDNPGELRRDLRKIVRKVDMVKDVKRVQKSDVRKHLQLKLKGHDGEEEMEENKRPGLWANMHAKKKRGEAPAKKGDKDYPSDDALKRARGENVDELAMGQGVEIKKTAVGDRPKGYGWSLKKSGQQTGKDHDVWHRVTKPVAQPKIRAGSPMYSSKNESFFFVAEDQIKKDGAKIKKAYAAIATEDMNVITKHLKKQGIDHDHDKGELYVRRQDHRDVMNHLNDLMKKKMIKSKPPVTAEKLDKDDEPFIKNLIKNLRKGSKTHGGQADDLEKAMKEARGVPRNYTKKYSNLNLKKARELMSPAKHRQDGIDRIAKGMGISKAKAAKHHDDVMKSYGFKAEDKGRGPTGIAYSLPKGHPDAENPATGKKYPERQTDKYKADYAKNSPLKLSGKFSKNESDDYHYSTGEPLNKKLSPKAQKAKDAQARIDKKFAPGGSYSKGADQIRKVIAKNEAMDPVTLGKMQAQAAATQRANQKKRDEKEKKDMAKKATHEMVTRRGKPIFQPKPDDSPERTAMIKSTQASLQKRKDRLAKAKKDRAAAYKAGKPFDMIRALGYGKSVEANEEKKKKTGLAAKAEKSGMPIGILRKVYNRGMAAWKTGHRPGTTPQQWAMARVNSFVTKSSGTWGKADKDLAAKVRAAKK